MEVATFGVAYTKSKAQQWITVTQQVESAEAAAKYTANDLEDIPDNVAAVWLVKVEHKHSVEYTSLKLVLARGIGAHLEGICSCGARFRYDLSETFLPSDKWEQI